MYKSAKQFIFRRITALLLLIFLTLSSCSSPQTGQETTPEPSRYKPTPTPIANTDNSINASETSPNVSGANSPVTDELYDFDFYMDQIFINEVTSDPLVFHQKITDPDSFPLELTQPDPVFPILDAGAMEEQKITAESILTMLKRYDYESLTATQKLTFEVLQYHLERILEQSNYPYYTSMLSFSTGAQIQFPILLSEYEFYRKKDITTYLELLKSLNSYFENIVNYEWERSSKGFFVPDSTINSIVSQCKSFLNNPDKNIFITSFSDRIQSCEWLSQEEKNEFIETNKTIVKNQILPAYQTFSEAITKLQGSGKGTGSYASFKDGPEFFQLYTQTKTGTNKTIPELKKQLENALQKYSRQILSLRGEYPELKELFQKSPFPETDPEKAVMYLKQASAENYPIPEGLNYTVKNVPVDLQPYLAPAMYFIPPLDRYEDNLIYINVTTNEDLNYIFPSLGHEGYPGHMLQSTYFLSSDPPLIRTVLSNLGYDEGWGLYAEMDSYRMSNLEKQEEEYFIANKIVTYCIYSLLEIGIQYEGFDEKDCIAFMYKFGTNESGAKTLYNMLIDNPCSYLTYIIGYLEISDLRTYAETRLADQFTLKEFHEFILSFGSAPFPVLKKYFYQWVEEKKLNSAFQYSDMFR